MSERFEGKVALVTGGGRGIGRAISQALIREGARVAIAQRSQPNVDGAHFFAVDLANAGDCAQAVTETVTTLGGLDLLVNNAGIMLERTAEAMTADEWDRTLAVNLRAPFLAIQQAVPVMRTRGGGAIVNISSIESLAANPGHAAYCASKAGLNGLTRAIAVDHGHENIRCNAIAPGWIDTELNTDFIASMPDPATFHAEVARIHPVRRTGKTEDVAALALWLLSDDADFVTGQIYTIDGGRTAQLSLPRPTTA